jgi:hypothetical protein
VVERCFRRPRHERILARAEGRDEPAVEDHAGEVVLWGPDPHARLRLRRLAD